MPGVLQGPALREMRTRQFPRLTETGGRSFRLPSVSATHGGAAARPGSGAGVRNSMGPLNQ